MYRLLKLVIIISGLLFISLLLISIIFTANIGRMGSPAKPSTGSLFHLIAILPLSDTDSFFVRVADAMKTAAKKDNAFLQVLTYSDGETPSDIAQLLHLAVELEADGIIISAAPDPSIISMVDFITSSGTPVIALESDLAGSSRAVFVGTNPYSIGTMAAKATIEAFPNGANVALILSHSLIKSGAKAAAVKAGFMYGIRRQRNISLELTKTASTALYAGDEIIRNLLGEYSHINLAIFVGARDAEGAGRALIEYDKVDKIAVIGFDDDPALLDLINLGVVKASIARFPEKLGEEAVTAAMTLARGDRSNAFIDPGLRIIKKGE